jgi:hypothetical protein
MYLVLVLFALNAITPACVKSLDPSHDPKKSLSDYVATSFAITSVEDKRKLLGFLTGDVKVRLEAWNEQQFREAFIESKKNFIKLSIREVKDISATEVEITYELTYIDQSNGKTGFNHSAKVTNKKLCRLIDDHGKWLIADVRNLKELIEYQNELTLP